MQAYNLPGAVLSALNVQIHLILTTILQGKYDHYSHFIDKELKQRAETQNRMLVGNRGEIQTLAIWLQLLCYLLRAYWVSDRHRAAYLNKFFHVLLRTTLENKY